MKVLFVDDEPDICSQAKIFLEKESERISVVTASNAEKALELLNENGFDVIVSDYKMPGMDGLEFLQRLRDKGNEIPFIMLTGKGNESVAMRATNLGIDRYFKKIQKGGSPKEQYRTIANSLFRIVGRAKSRENNLIGWVEIEPVGNVESIKHDFRELSEELEFRITDFEVATTPWKSGNYDVVGVYTDTYSKVPKEESSKVKEWKNKVLWDTNIIIDFDILIKGDSEKYKTETLRKKEIL